LKATPTIEKAEGGGRLTERGVAAAEGLTVQFLAGLLGFSRKLL